MTDHDAELREAAEPSKPKPSATQWLWEHRRTVAPFIGVALAILCPHLGPISGPCKLVGEVVRTWSYGGQVLP